MKVGNIQLKRSVMPRETDHHRATACYENAVPSFVEVEIEKRYGSLFATLPHFRHTEKLLASTSTYVAHVDGRLETLLLFNRSHNHIIVLNELIYLPKQEVAAFATFIFKRYTDVNTISFNAVRTEFEGLAYPAQGYFCSEDIVISSLTDLVDYTARLKSSTRKNIRRHGNALLRTHSSFAFTVLSARGIDQPLVQQIIQFNKARMANKDRVSAYTDDESQWITALASARGLAGIITIDGKICAGAICCDICSNCFILVTAHDPAYDQFGLGMLCSYWTICECIARDGKAVHLLWGRLPYKFDLSGVPQRFDRVTVYRSYVACLRHLDKILAASATGLVREARWRLLDAKGQHTFGGRCAGLMWSLARPTKRFVNAIRRIPS